MKNIIKIVSLFIIASCISRGRDTSKPTIAKNVNEGIGNLKKRLNEKKANISIILKSPEMKKNYIQVLTLLKSNPLLLDEFSKIKEDFTAVKEIIGEFHSNWNEFLGIKYNITQNEGNQGIEQIELDEDNEIAEASITTVESLLDIYENASHKFPIIAEFLNQKVQKVQNEKINEMKLNEEEKDEIRFVTSRLINIDRKRFSKLIDGILQDLHNIIENNEQQLGRIISIFNQLINDEINEKSIQSFKEIIKDFILINIDLGEKFIESHKDEIIDFLSSNEESLKKFDKEYTEKFEKKTFEG